MKHAKLMLFMTPLLTLTLTVWFLGSGCKSDDTTGPQEDLTVPDDIFPLVTAHQIEYSGYLTQNDTEVKISGSDVGYYTKWTIAGEVPVNSVFPNPPFTNLSGNAILVLDTTRIPATGVAAKYTAVMLRYDPATAKYSLLTNFGYFYRTFQIKEAGSNSIRSDSLRWVVLANPRVGIGKEFNTLDPAETFSGSVAASPVQIKLEVLGKFEGRETITIGSTAYQAYRLVISNKVSIGTSTVGGGVTAKLWVVKGLGPVKMFLAGDAESPGHFRLMTSKNF